MSALREQIKAKLEALLSSQKTAQVKHKLKILNDVCEELAKKKADFSIPLIVSQMTNNKVKISEQTFYNQRKGGNPYRELYDIWLAYSIEVKKVTKTSAKASEDDIFSNEDLKGISDPVLRYRVNLLFAELVALRNQNKMIREIKELPSIHTVPAIEQRIEDPNLIEQIMLDSYEVDLIDELLIGTPDIGFDENGGLIAKRNIRSGTRLLPSGFEEALQKIIDSHKLVK